MIKTNLRRWWLLNRLFHFSKHHHGMVAPQEYFLQWMIGMDISNRVPGWYTGTTHAGRLSAWFTWKLFNSTSARRHRILPDVQLRELDSLVDECINKNFIRKSGGSNITLTHIGLEHYSFSYLLSCILGNAWIKGIGIGLIVGFLVWYTTDRINKAIPTNIQIQYIPQEIRQPSI